MVVTNKLYFIIPEIFTDLDSSDFVSVMKVPLTDTLLIGYNVNDSKSPFPTISLS